MGFVSAVLCVLLVAISAEASSETPTRVRLLFGSATSCAFLACAMSILGEVLHTIVSWMQLGKWGWTAVVCLVIAAGMMVRALRHVAGWLLFLNDFFKSPLQLAPYCHLPIGLARTGLDKV